MNDYRIVLDRVGHVMTSVRMAEEVDYAFKQDGLSAYNVTLRCFRVTIVVVEKQ
jgi:hypothetical protein